MLDAIPYALLFLGPFLLAFFLGKKLLRAPCSAFAIGLLAFLVASVCCAVAVAAIQMVTQVLLAGTTLATLLMSAVVGASAGLFEESSRFFAFRLFRSLRQRRDWSTGIMYTIGHSGMESIMVGGILLLLVAVAKYGGQVVPPDIVDKFKPILELTFQQRLYISLERLFVGLLVHSCFTSVVLLGFIRSQKRYLLIAMLWHCVHNMIGINLQHFCDHWIAEKLWVLVIVVGYSWILLRLRRAMLKAEGE